MLCIQSDPADDHMNENSAVITANTLYKVFKLGEERVRALDGVSLTVREGEFVAIVGTSGSGKSTLLNLLAGLDKPTKGEIIIYDRHIERMNESQLVGFRRDNVGFIFQAYDLLPQFNAIENVSLPLSFWGIDRPTREKMAKKALKQVGLEGYMKHRPTEMSGGQQQRVGIARAIVTGPRLIFADEPTGNLDSKTTEDILHLLQKMVHDGMQTLIMVTHDNNLASYADRRIHIKDGKIVKED